MAFESFWGSSGAEAGGGDAGDPIGQSLRFRGNQYLQGPALPTAFTGTQTWSFWFKRGALTGSNWMIGSSNGYGFGFDSPTPYQLVKNGNGGTSDASYRDTSAWYHLVVSGDASAGKTRQWMNGQEITGITNLFDPYWTAGSSLEIGTLYSPSTSSYGFDGYIAEVHCIDGQELDPTTFGRFNSDGVWVPVNPSNLTYGTNGFHLTFADPLDVGKDYSGNGNDFTATGFELTDTSSPNYDLMQDSPTNNFATFNAIGRSVPNFLKAANQQLWGSNNWNNYQQANTQVIQPGDVQRYYFIIEGLQGASGGSREGYGLVQGVDPTNTSKGGDGVATFGQTSGSRFTISGTSTGAYSNITPTSMTDTSATSRELVVIDYSDPVDCKFYYYNSKQGGKWIENDTNIGGTFTLSDTFDADKPVMVYTGGLPVAPYAVSVGRAIGLNMGQRPPAYAAQIAEAGAVPFCTANTPTPAIADGRDHFRAITGPGNAAGHAYGDNSVNQPSGNQGSAFNPAGLDVAPFPNASSNVPNASYTSHVLDFLQERSTVTCTFGSGAGITLQVLLSVDGVAWRDQGNVADWQRDITFADGQNFRYVRTVSTNGTTPYGLFISATNVASPGILGTAQGIFPNGLWWIKDRVNSNQHQLVNVMNGTADVVQSPAGTVGNNYSAPTGGSVAWCWKAGDTTVANTDGTINSTVRANPDAGFSIVQYTGTQATDTVGHGLNGVPEFIVTAGYSGFLTAYHSAPTTDGFFYLNKTNAWSSSSGIWNPSEMTDTTFGLGGNVVANQSSVDFTAYVWTSVPGYSAFGSYTGNSSANGPFVYLGFRPAFVLIKSTASGDWHIYDSTREIANPETTPLRSNQTAGESTIGSIDFLSNGFKLRTNTAINASATYLYAAFAENPFQSPVTAR